MSIPPRFMDELRRRLTLSDVAGKRLRLVRAGREFKGCCPFHKEKTASFYINDDKQFYHCFGCGAHGDVIGFVMQHDNLSFIDAVEMLAAQAGMEVPKPSPGDRKKYESEKNLYTLMEEAAKFMEESLRRPENREALNYILERGIKEETLSAYRIGYAPGDGQALRSRLLSLGFTDEQMTKAGVLRASARGGEPYAFFRDRIMFPVPDRRGRIVAFGGRILPENLRPPDTGDFKTPKYMNSSDTPLFDKGSMLYGEPHARQAAADGSTVLVVEGYLDVISCFQAGFHGTLAPMGTALTEEQILVLWKIIPGEEKKPVLCFDGDEAGRRAAARACDRMLPLLKPGHSALLAFLPEGEDPDSLIKASGRNAFRKILDGAVPLVDYLWTYHAGSRDLVTPEGQAGLRDVLEREVSLITDRNVQAFYRQAFRKRISESFFSRRNEGDFQNRNTSVLLSRPVRKAQDLQLKILLAAVINHPQILDVFEEEYMSLEYQDRSFRSLQQEILEIWQAGEGIGGEGLRNILNERGYKEILDKLLSGSIYIHAGFARRETSFEKALEGWREIMERKNKESLHREHKEAGAVLASDLNEENESRMLALYDMQNTGDA